jgi:hypothetical protein
MKIRKDKKRTEKQKSNELNPVSRNPGKDYSFAPGQPDISSGMGYTIRRIRLGTLCIRTIFSLTFRTWGFIFVADN